MSKVNKKVAIGLASGIAGAAAIITAIVLLTRRQHDGSTKEQNYLDLFNKIKDLNNFVINDNARQENSKLLDELKANEYSKENESKLNDIFKKIQDAIKNEDAAIESDIQKIKSENKKQDLKKKLENAKNYSDRKKVWDEAKSIALKEYPRDFELDKKEVNELIKHIKDPSKKDSFLRELSQTKDFDQLDKLKKDVEAELLNQGTEDYINAKKDSLTAKIDAAKNLTDEQKEELKKLVNDSDNLNKISDAEEKVNNEIAKAKLKAEALEKLNLLKSSDLKNELSDKIQNPNASISDYFDVISQVDNLLNALKEKAKGAIEEVNNQKNREALTQELNKAKTQQELEKVLKDAQNTKVLELLLDSDEAKNLDKKEIESLINRINDKNKRDQLTKQLEKANTPKEIEDLKNQVESNIDSNLLIEAKKQALKDKIDASNLSKEEKDLLKTKVDSANSENFEKINKEVNDALLFGVLKEKAKEAVERLSDSDIKSELTHDLNVVNDPKEAYDVLTKANNQYNKTKEEAKKAINALKNDQTKESLNYELSEVTNEDEVKKVKAKAEAILALEDQKERIQESINKLSNEEDKKKFEKLLSDASTKEELDKIEKELKDQVARETVDIDDYLNKQKEAIKDRIDSSSLDSITQKDGLKNEVDNARNQSEIDAVKQKVDDAIKNKALLDATKQALKEKIKDANIPNDEFNRLNDAIDAANVSNIEDVKKQVDDALKAANPNLEKQLELDKKEIAELIKFLNYSDTKDALNKELESTNDKESLKNLKQKVEEAIKNEALFDAAKTSLLNQINAADLTNEEKESLKQKANAARSMEDINNVAKDLENALKDKILKQKANDAIQNLKDGSKKDELQGILNDPESSASNFLEVINSVDKLINESKQKAKEEINKVEDEAKKQELLAELEKATTQAQIEEIISKAKSQNGAVDLNKVKELVNKLSDQNDQKANLLAVLNNESSTDSQIKDVENKAKELLKAAKDNALAAVEKAKGADEYSDLLAKVNDANANEDSLNKAKEDALNLYNVQKEKTKQTLDNFDNNHNRKPELTNALENAKNIDVLKVIDKSIKALEAIEEVKSVDKNKELTNRLDAVNENTENPIAVIDQIISDAKLQKAIEEGDEIEIIKAQALQLPYPGGSDSAAIKEIIAKIDEIKKNASLTNEQKLEQARAIKDTFESIKEKINDAIAEIAKLSPQKQVELNNELNNTNLIPSDEFPSLMTHIEDAKAADKEAAKKIINDLEHLEEAEKTKFKNDLDADSVNSYSDIVAIVDNAKLADKKKDLIKKVDALEYPNGQNAQAIADLKARINATSGNEAPITLEKANDFENIISNIAGEIADIKNKIAELTGDYDDVKTKFNEADTNEEFESLKELIASKKASEQSQNKKSRVEALIESLEYPKTDGTNFSTTEPNTSAAIVDLKNLYKDLEGEQLNQKLDEIENDLPRIRTSIAEAKSELAKISDKNKKTLSVDSESGEINLFEKLSQANTQEEFNKLNELIAKAKQKDKDDAKAEIEKLTHLDENLKQQFKNEVDSSLDSQAINSVLERAKLRDKHEDLKKIITQADYIPNGTSVDGLANKVNESISAINAQILLTTDGNIEAKREELNNLKTKLNALRDQINNLNDSEVSNLQNTKNELLSLLGSKHNLADLNEVEIAIEKAKLKKQAENLEYPSTNNATAINDLKARIDEISDTSSIEDFKQILNALPDRIQEIKNMISELDNTSNTTISEEEKERRKTDLNNELDRADTDQEFERLKQHINDAKTQSQEQYEAQEKERLKERVRSLPYPSRTAAAAISEIIAEIDSSQNTSLSALVEKVNNIESKINSNNIEIAKVSPERKAELNTLLDSANTYQEFTNLEQKIQEAKNADKQDIANQINALEPLSNKQSFINDLENKSYDQMKEVLKRAKLENLKAKINALPYPANNATAKRELLLEAEGLSTDQEIDNKIVEINNLHQAITAVVSTINSLPYPNPQAQGKNDFKATLNSLKTVDKVNGLVPSDWADKIRKYDSLRTATLNPIPEDAREYGLKTRLNSMNTLEEENELAWNLFETKRRRTLVDTINALSNLDDPKKRELISEIQEIPESQKTQPIVDLEDKMQQIDAVILKAQKLNAKNRVDLISYPDTNNSLKAKDTLKRKIESATNLATINSLIQENNRIDTRMDELNIEVAQILDENRRNEINNMLNNVDEMSDFTPIQLKIDQAKAVQSLSDLTHLSLIQRTDYANRIDATNFANEIETIKQEAQLQNKKERIKALIDQLPYPNRSSTNAQNSIRSLKESIDNLNSNDELDLKEIEINNFSTALTNKIAVANELPYNNQNSEAENAIKNAFNSATSIDDLNRLLPETWSNDVRNYKDIIHAHFSRTHGLNSRLDKTYPTRTRESSDSNFTVEELKNQIYSTKRNNANEKIDGFRHLTQEQRNEFKRRVREVQNTLPNESALTNIDAIVVEATKENYNKFIDNLAYPNPSDLPNVDDLATRVNRTKQEIKDAYTNPITKNTQLIGRNSLEENLNNLNNKINTINTKIRQIHDSSTTNSFKEKLADANHTELDALLREIDQKINQQNEQINRDREAARAAIDTLPTRNRVRNDLNSRLANANTSTALEAIKNEADTERQLLDNKIQIANSKLNLLPQDNPKRTELTTLLNDQNQTYEVEHIDRIISQAEAEKELLDLKQEVKQLIDTIPYPSSSLSSNSVTNLKNSVDALNTIQDVQNKRNEIQAFKQKLEEKINAANRLPYPATTSSEAIRKIKEEFNSATNVQDLNRILPDTWSNDLTQYKNTIRTYIENPSGLNPRINRTTPTRTDDFSLDQLKHQIHETKKDQSRNKINALSNLDRNKRNEFIAQLNALRNVLPQNESLAAMDRIVLDATKENYKKFIDNLAYPSDNSDLINNSRATKNEIKSALANTITKETRLRGSGSLEERLNAINSKINDINQRINQIQDNNTKNNFKTELSNANHEELDALFIKVNQHVNGQNAQIELDRSAARNAIAALPEGNTVKGNLNTRLASAQTSKQLTDIKNEAVAEKNRLDNARNQAVSSINALPGNNAKKVALNTKLNNNSETNEESKLNAIKAEADNEKQRFDSKKQEAITKLNQLPTTNAKRNELMSELNNTDNTFEVSHIEAIIRQAEAEKALVDLREEIKNIINNIPYPNKPQATRAIERLKQEVDALNDTTALNNKKREIESFKNLMQTKVNAANALPYPSTNASAIADIKNEFNNATTSARLNQILPDTWNAELLKYKNAIASHFNSPANLNARLDQTHPIRTDGYSVANLKTQIHDTKKNNVTTSINGLSNLSQTEKQGFINRINALSKDVLPEQTNLNQMNTILAEANERNNKKSQAQTAINALPAGNALKTRLQNELNTANIQRLVAIKSEAEAEKRRLDELEAKRTEARREIEKLPQTNNDRNRLLGSLGGANTLAEIENIKNEAIRKLTEFNNAKQQAKNEINSINFPNSTSTEQNNKASAIRTLNAQIDNASNISEIDALKANNQRLKSAVDRAIAEINKLDRNQSANAITSLKNELASQTTASGADAVANKARQAKARETTITQEQRTRVQNEINKLTDSRKKADLTNRLNAARQEEVLNEIEAEAILERLILLNATQVDGGLPNNSNNPNDLTTQNLKNEFYNTAKSKERATLIQNKIKEQLRAEEADLRKSASDSKLKKYVKGPLTTEKFGYINDKFGTDQYDREQGIIYEVHGMIDNGSANTIEGFKTAYNKMQTIRPQPASAETRNSYRTRMENDIYKTFVGEYSGNDGSRVDYRFSPVNRQLLNEFLRAENFDQASESQLQDIEIKYLREISFVQRKFSTMYKDLIKILELLLNPSHPYRFTEEQRARYSVFKSKYDSLNTASGVATLSQLEEIKMNKFKREIENIFGTTDIPSDIWNYLYQPDYTDNIIKHIFNENNKLSGRITPEDRYTMIRDLSMIGGWNKDSDKTEYRHFTGSLENQTTRLNEKINTYLNNNDYRGKFANAVSDSTYSKSTMTSFLPNQ